MLSVDEDGTLLLLYPYSDGVIDLLRVPLDGSDVTRVHSFRLAEDSGDEDGSLYFSLQGAALTGDCAYVTAYGLNPEAMYGLNQLFELNLKDGSVRKVTEDYIGIILPLDDTSLIGYYDNRYTGADDPLTALVRINRQTGLTDTLCEMESDSSFSGFTMSGTSVVFNDGSQVLRVAAPYDTVETVGYLPPAYVYTNLPGCVSGNSYYTYNYDTGLTSIDLTAPLPAPPQPPRRTTPSTCRAVRRLTSTPSICRATPSLPCATRGIWRSCPAAATCSRLFPKCSRI